MFESLIQKFKGTPVTVYEYERGVHYVRGRFAGILLPGLHYTKANQNHIVKVDIREQSENVEQQEILTADGVSPKVTLVAKYKITDVAVSVNTVSNLTLALHLELQLALRELVNTMKLDDLLTSKASLSKQLLELCLPKVQVLGVTLASVNIKDILLPTEIKNAFAQVTKAQKESMAALERARGETAALRNLANIAKLLEENPMLLQLRAIQAVGASSGNSIVLGTNVLPKAAAQ